MQIKAGKTPVDAYVETSIASGSIVDIQNKSSRILMVFAGDSAPSSLDDYFILDSFKTERYQGAVMMIWSDFEGHSVMVQEIA